MDFEIKNRYNAYDLVEIVKLLRAPNGCPWDKVQTHESIRKDFIEEVYEAVEAIDEKDSAHLREELGDVLLQVVFHSVLESEEGRFSFDDVADEVCKKMIIRHPHVFGDVTAETPEEVLKNWDAIKMQTHEQTFVSEAMDSVSKTLPSLMRAEKLCKKAKRGGVYPESVETAFSGVYDDLDRLKDSAVSGSNAVHERIGELLFSVVRLSAMLGADCEKSLYDTCGRFIELFRAYEGEAAKSGIDIQGSDTEVTNQLWKEIKNTNGGNLK